MKKLLDVIFVIGILLAIINFVYRENIIYAFFIINGLLLLVFYFVKYSKRYMKLVYFIIIFSIIYLIKIIFYQQIGGILKFSLLISNIGYGIYLIEEKKALNLFRNIYIILMFILFFFFISGVKPSDISEYSSGNIVNFIVLAFSLTMIRLYNQRTNRIIVLPAVLSIFVSIWTLGRMGIISSILLLVGIIIVILIENKDKLNKYILSTILMLLVALSYFLADHLVNIINGIFTKFGRKSTTIMDDPRVFIIKDYFSKLDLSKIIFGFDFTEHYFNGFINLHNGFLNIHYSFGIGGLLIILILFYVVITAIKKKQYLSVVLIFCLFFRMSTDTLLLVGVYDFTLVYLVLSVLICKYKETNYNISDKYY